MKRLTRIEQIQTAALNRRAVIVPASRCFCKPIAAAWIINLQGNMLCRLLSLGVFLYPSKQKKETQP